LRGVGIVPAASEIQIDRFSAKSGEGVAISFLEDANPHAGWKTAFSADQSWVRFNEVDFGRGGRKAIEVRANAPGKAVLEIRLDKPDGALLGRVKIGQASGWQSAKVASKNIPAGVHHLVVVQAGPAPVAVDWISFRPSR
jgi:hypothetical protein